LVHERLEDYLAALASRGFRTMINTNGVLLTPARIDRLAGLGLSTVNLSLDGLWDTHDRLRHGPGSFQGALDVLHYLAHHTKLKANVISVIHAQNAAELPELVRVVSERLPRGHVRFQAILPTLSKPWTDEFFRDDPLWPRSPKVLEAVLAALGQLEALRDAGLPIVNPPSQFELWRRYFRDPLHFATTESCEVGLDSFIVMADGVITFCHHFGELATIDDDPREVWESAAARQMREAMRTCRQPCNYRVNCCYVEG
jgi:MoaA/NifB/PqqE/SkfB family radical SAM enzyme